jgi:hypothetical protein
VCWHFIRTVIPKIAAQFARALRVFIDRQRPATTKTSDS